MRRSLAPLVLLAGCLLVTGCASTQKAQAGSGRQVRLSMGQQMGARGDWTGAFQVADGLTREDPEDEAAWVLRGKALRRQEMNAEAESDLRRALQLAPEDAEAHAELGVLLERTGRPRDAMAQHEEARRLAPGNPRYLNNLAFAFVIRGKGREAVPLLEEALRAEPGSPILRNNLGFALASTGDFSRAAEQFRLGGDKAQGKVNLGFAYERSGNLAQAYESYLAAVRLSPADERARRNLEHVTRELGREPPPELSVPAPLTVEKGGS